MIQRRLLSGNEAIALAALHGGVTLGTGYPGTPSTEILENFSTLKGRAQWAPNEKVAMEVAIGASLGGGATIVTMKHVGVNVAADPLFTLTHIELPGPLVLIAADDPGMASSQNEQDSRRYAVAAGLPMLEPSDSQEAYEFMLRALEISRRFHMPVLLRVTTRVCHSKTIVTWEDDVQPPTVEPHFQRAISQRVMLPGYARPAHRRLREKLSQAAQFNETSDLHVETPGDFPAVAEATTKKVGIVTSGISYTHVCEAAPEAAVLKLGMTYPLPLEAIRRFADSVERLVAIEEGDPFLVEQLRTAGIPIEGKPEMYRFGELSVSRVERILARDTTPEPVPPKGKPPALCVGCPHRKVFETLSKFDCIVAGDIGCYTLGVMPPFEAMDALVCMGASIGMGLGLRHTLPEVEARRVVSVIGDSTFVHSGITGLVEMAYNRPATGHVVLLLDNSTTAMTGLQEHPGTGRTLDHQPAHQLDYVSLARSIGIEEVDVIDPVKDFEGFQSLLQKRLASDSLSLIVVRRPCILAAAKIKQYEKEQQEKCEATQGKE